MCFLSLQGMYFGDSLNNLFHSLRPINLTITLMSTIHQRKEEFHHGLYVCVYYTLASFQHLCINLAGGWGEPQRFYI